MYQYANKQGTAGLEDYLAAIKARKLLVVAIAIIVLLLAHLGLSSMTPSYTAAATVLIGPSPVGAVDDRLQPPNLEREREIMLSDRVARRVVEGLDTELPPGAALQMVTVQFQPASDVLRVSATSQDPSLAAAVANGFASIYVRDREAEALSQLERRLQSLDRQLSGYDQELAELNAQQAALQAERQQVQSDPNIGDATRSARTAELNERIAVLQTRMNTLVSSTNSLRPIRANTVSAIDARQTAAAVLREADPPSVPNGVSRTAVYALALIMGTGLGVVAAFVAQRLDRTARSEQEVAEALDTRVLGGVPNFGRASSVPLVMAATARKLPILQAREAFRRLASALAFLERTDEVQVVAVTSAHPREGKTSVVANLAVALTEAGKRVAVVSADLRQPTLERRLQLDNSAGLSQFLQMETDEAVAQVPDGYEDLLVFTAGPSPANPAELLASPRFSALLDQLRKEVDITLVDTAPLLNTADALAMMTLVDGVMMVVDSRRTQEHELRRAQADIARAGGRLIGAVVNKERVSRRRLFGRGDRYAYYQVAPT